VPALFSLAYLHAGSKSAECAECRAYFAAHPDLGDPGRAEDFGLRCLEADRPGYQQVENLAGLLLRVGRTARLREVIEGLLRENLEAAALGRLVRARNRLDAGR
jgi:hypothetical protein